MDSGASMNASVGNTAVGVGCKLVSPEYFGVLGINLVQGRLFAPDERSAAAGVVVISGAVAQRFWPNGDALGHTIRLDDPSDSAARDERAPRIPAQTYTVLGVVRDVRRALKLVDFGYSGIYLPEQAETSFACACMAIRM